MRAYQFYLDIHIAGSIAHGLRQAGHAVETALTQGLADAGDEEHLLRAASRGWAL